VGFFLALVGMVLAYLVLIELAKRLFFADPAGRLPDLRRRGREHQLQRRAARFSVASSPPPMGSPGHHLVVTSSRSDGPPGGDPHPG
jgi:Mg2+-importing ATPase